MLLISGLKNNIAVMGTNKYLSVNNKQIFSIVLLIRNSK